MKPILSIAIPAHNEEKYLARCLLSITTSCRKFDQFYYDAKR